MLGFRNLVTTICGFVAGATLAFSSAATATAAPALELTRGAAEPVESITTQLGATVSNGGNDFLFVHLKPVGGEACGANVPADHGEEVVNESISSATSPVALSHNWTFRNAGSYRICAWVATSYNGEGVVAFAESTMAVRAPHLALAISVPAQVAPDQTFQVLTTAQAETERQAWEYAIPNTGDGCPANAKAAENAPGANEIFGYWAVTGGPLTETRDYSLSLRGSYLFCAYFQYPGTESAPELTASAETTVVTPPPPCVVPGVHIGGSLASIKRSIRAASCSVGKISSAPSASVGRGGVLGLSPGPGAKRSAGAAVSIIISAGRPCVVPSVRTGSTLAHVERQLAAADCTATVIQVRSRHVRRGDVVNLSMRAHARLFPRSKVGILISTGRH
jgi:hypothetical protein